MHVVFHNNGDGTATDVSRQCGIGAAPGEGLGLAMNDYDQDGWPDVFINALPHQKYGLFHNVGSTFDYVSGSANVGLISQMHSGWGAHFIDYNSDGCKDLLVARGHVMDNIELTEPLLRYREPLLLIRNVHGNFEDVSKQSGDPFQLTLAARGAAFGDLNNDGYPEAVINCRDGGPVVLSNFRGNGNHWLLVNTIGCPAIEMASGREFVSSLHLAESSTRWS